MLVFEFRNKETRCGGIEGLRTLIIGDNYRAYELNDGSVRLNDEHHGFTFYPQETYDEFRKQFNLDWKAQLMVGSSLTSNYKDL